jgi:peptidoglycan hydrolase-like protein with peptidoglycan-binding domain
MGIAMSEQATAEHTVQVTLSLPILRKTGPEYTSGRAKRLQHMLNDAYGLSGTPYKLAEDGWFGPKTEEAVKRYQDNEDIVVDGMVGRQTYTKLVSAWLSGDEPG